MVTMKSCVMKTETQTDVSIHLEDVVLAANLTVPEKARGIVLFSHGSGSSRFSPRNRFVAEELNHSGIATLLVDLLTRGEDDRYETRFDIGLLTRRLSGITRWVTVQPELKHLHVGYFGASTGAASALRAAAMWADKIFAVVSRGGRPDLAKNALPLVQAPTLLIVGSFDEQVIELNEEAYEQLNCLKHLEIVEGASHLFEEPGKLEEVAVLAAKWFDRYLQPELEKME